MRPIEILVWRISRVTNMSRSEHEFGRVERRVASLDLIQFQINSLNAAWQVVPYWRSSRGCGILLHWGVSAMLGVLVIGKVLLPTA